MKKNGLILFFLTLLFAGSNCTLEPFNGGSDTMITEEDLESATLILGDALSDGNGGIFLSVQDAINIIAGNSIYPKVNPQEGNTGDNNTKAKWIFQTNYNAVYNEENGMHTITFQRWSEDELSTEYDSLNYIYRDKDGTFIAWPMDSDTPVESVTFEGFKNGVHQKSNRVPDADTGVYTYKPLNTTSYEQKSTFLITGVSGSRTAFPAEGSHTEKGFVQYFERDKTFLNRYFELEIDLLNITVHVKQFVCEMANKVSEITDTCGPEIKTDFEGEATLEMKTWRNPEKQDTPVSLSGVVQFNGDGTAKINFREADAPVVIKTNVENVKSEQPTIVEALKK